MVLIYLLGLKERLAGLRCELFVTHHYTHRYKCKLNTLNFILVSLPPFLKLAINANSVS